MRYSLTTGAAGEGFDPRGLADLAALAEDHGWDAFFLEDYLVYRGAPQAPAYDPWICLAAMATATTTIRLGPSVAAVPRRRPWKLAAEAVSLDHLSGGRVVLGVGSGAPDNPDFHATGEPTDRRTLAGRLDEALTIVDALWTGGPVDFEGAHFRVEGLRLPARPIQRPRIPIWVGGNLDVPSIRRRVLRWDGCVAYKGSGPIEPDDIRRLRAEAGPDLDIRCEGTSDPERIAEYEAAGATWWSIWSPPEPAALKALLRKGPPRG